jgi:hypothetical protein
MSIKQTIIFLSTGIINEAQKTPNIHLFIPIPSKLLPPIKYKRCINKQQSKTNLK